MFHFVDFLNSYVAIIIIAFVLLVMFTWCEKYHDRRYGVENVRAFVIENLWEGRENLPQVIII